MDAVRTAVAHAQSPLIASIEPLASHPWSWPLLGLGLVILASGLALLWRVVRLTRRLEVAEEEADREGERASAVETGPNPLANFSRFGILSDPLNVRVVAHTDQLVTAFAAAGWYRADRIRLLSSLRLSVATVFGLRYSSAPMSNLYLYGRKQDLAFQKPGPSVRVRDHVRFWDTGERAPGGRPIWIGGATRDIAVELSPRTRLITHKVAPDIDAERETLVRDLTTTGWVERQTWEPGFGRATELVNAMGYPMITDGRIAVVTLADAPVLLALTTGLRGRLASAVTRLMSLPEQWIARNRGRRRAGESGDEAEPMVPRSRRPRAEA